jgi:ribonuclease D
MFKGETRTDWRRRPLTESQLDYAAGDVAHLAPLRERLSLELTRRTRREWYDQELVRVLERSRPQPSQGYLKLQGLGGLSDRARRIVRGLWEWRDEQAEWRNCSPRRILRDDLIVEIARRGHTDPQRILAIRGIPAPLAGAVDEISQRIQDALEQPLPTKPSAFEVDMPAEVDLITQYLAVFLGLRCRQESIATMLVGRSQEIRDLVVSQWTAAIEPPDLLQGWRAGLVGNDMLRLLRGETALRIGNLGSAMSLFVEPQTDAGLR